MSDLIKQLSKTLRKLRQNQTQRDFARKLGIDVATLNRLENKNENITLKTIQKMCNNLKCSVGDLFDESKKNIEEKKDNIN